MKAPIATHVLPAHASFDSGELVIAGISATELAKKFGTPAFIIDEGDFNARARAFNTALKNAMGDRAGHCYYHGTQFAKGEIQQQELPQALLQCKHLVIAQRH